MQALENVFAKLISLPGQIWMAFHSKMHFPMPCKLLAKLGSLFKNQRHQNISTEKPSVLLA